MKKLSSLLVILLFAVTASLARDPRKASGRGLPVASETLTAKQKVSGARGALAPNNESAVLVGAGDIAGCGQLQGAQETAKLLDHIPGTVFADGDLAYGSGSDNEFAHCYDPTWGRHKARTRPAPGNHDYRTPGAAGYFHYFGAAAGDPEKGYYSYDLGAWHIIVLNSNCAKVGGCQPRSPQEQWLRADLAAHPAACTLAYWHHPLFTSGAHSRDANLREMRTFWQDLYEAGADVVINGHDHDYERFAPQDPNGSRDAERGIREFVAGTGGKDLRRFVTRLPNSEVRSQTAFGVLKLALHPTSYEWEYVPVRGQSFTDSGQASCHRAGAAGPHHERSDTKTPAHAPAAK